MGQHRSPSLSDGEISNGGDGEKVTKNTSHRASTSVNSSTRHSKSSSRPLHPVGRQALMYDSNAHFNDYGRDRARSRSPYRKRDRSRSRSPYRADRDGGNKEKRRHKDDHYGQGSSEPRRHKSTSSDDRRDPRLMIGTRDRSRSPYRAEVRTAASKSSAQPADWESAASDVNGKERGSVSFAQSKTDSVSDSHVPATKEEAEEPSEPPRQMTEAELIEERRKKREAIRKKHAAAAGTNDSLLRTTLESNLPSAAPTPYHESSGQGSVPQSPPSSLNSPRTPMEASFPNSPASPGSPALFNDVDLANPIQLDANEEPGQSAADYDPNKDMNEDRPDHKRQDVQPQSDPVEPTAAKPTDDFDMFADDDDDMFAADNAPLLINAPKQAKTLDESLLDNWDYPDGHYRIINGELLDGRYAVEQQIGKGTFATVVRATDAQSGRKVAIKIACRNDTMFKAGQKEMQFLNRLNEADPDDKKCIIRLLADFMHKGHLCLVFEGLEMDLRETLKKFGRDVGINPEAIQIYARQMFLALLHMKTMEVLHADLKPDNILVSSDNKLVKICDFGTATLQQDAELTPYLVSRFYRAPEVIIGMDFDYAIDMWSIGCTLYELYTGRILFNGADNNNMLRVIQECRGKLPNRLIKKSQLAANYFDEQFIFHGRERDKMTGNIVSKPMHFSQGVNGKDLKSRLSANTKKMDVNQLKMHNSFVDLLDKCLQLDPEKRIKPKDALRHPFIARETAQSAKAKTLALPKGFRPAVVQRAG